MMKINRINWSVLLFVKR